MLRAFNTNGTSEWKVQSYPLQEISLKNYSQIECFIRLYLLHNVTSISQCTDFLHWFLTMTV